MTCNGRRLPLQPTGEPSVFVAAVRYKAWQAVFGLHPTIGAHAPLVFDVFDRRLGRSIGGCVYHVNHPGGLSYEKFPVNAYEAESRRISRFWAWGHTAGEAALPPWVRELRACYAKAPELLMRDPGREQANPEYPYTLDLRRLPFDHEDPGAAQAERDQLRSRLTTINTDNTEPLDTKPRAQVR